MAREIVISEEWLVGVMERWWGLILPKGQNGWLGDQPDLAGLSREQRAMFQASIGIHPCDYIICQGVLGNEIPPLTEKIIQALCLAGLARGFSKPVVDEVIRVFSPELWVKDREEEGKERRGIRGLYSVKYGHG